MALKDENLIASLRRELTLPLPGKEIQYHMAPVGRDNRLPRFTGREKPRASSVMILLYREDDRWKFPLILRPEYSGVHSGQMALPGGRGEDFDRDRIATALRETREEIGINATGIEVVGKLTELDVVASNNNVLPVVGYFPGMPVFNPDPEEVQSIHIVCLDEIMEEHSVKYTTLTINEKYNIETPYYDVGGNIVWGATAMILSEFLYIVKRI